MGRAAGKLHTNHVCHRGFQTYGDRAVHLRVEWADDLQRIALEICTSPKCDYLSGVPTTSAPGIDSKFMVASTGCCINIHMDGCLPVASYGSQRRLL